MKKKNASMEDSADVPSTNEADVVLTKHQEILQKLISNQQELQIQIENICKRLEKVEYNFESY